MSKSGVSERCRSCWEGMRFRDKGRDSEAVGRAEGRESEALAGLGLARIVDCISI